jgi:hypothetical protein
MQYESPADAQLFKIGHSMGMSHRLQSPDERGYRKSGYGDYLAHTFPWGVRIFLIPDRDGIPRPYGGGGRSSPAASASE